MTPLKKSEYEALLRYDLVGFIERSFYELNPQSQLIMGWYIEAIAAKIEACRRGEIKRLIINLPPRYLKSHCVSIVLVAWLLGHNPGQQVICASYGQDLSDKLGRDCRTIMMSDWYKKLFKTRLSPQKTAINDFMTTDFGFRMATSVGGVLTGRGADTIIIDDPLKPDEALSESQRKAVNEWFDHTLLSRLNDKTNGCIIIIMQRLHQDDLIGHVLQQGHWDVLSLPAIAEHDETHFIPSVLGDQTIHRKQGEALHPERESVAMLNIMRDTIGSYHFSSQYQQNPEPLGGALVKTAWLKYYKEHERPPKFDRIAQSWDTANKATEFSDYSVCTTWGIKGNLCYLLHVFRKRLEFPDLKRAVKEQAALFRPSVILIEDRASGTALIQELINEGLAGVTRYEPAADSKIMRLYAQTSKIEQGQLLLPIAAPWLADYIRELISFPGAKHDDQVDSTTQFLAWLALGFPGQGMLEYYRELTETLLEPPPGRLVKVLVPLGIGEVQVFSGAHMTVPPTRILEMYEEDAQYLLSYGWSLVPD